MVVIATYVTLDHDGKKIDLALDIGGIYSHAESDERYQSYKSNQLLINYMIFVIYSLTSSVRNSKVWSTPIRPI